MKLSHLGAGLGRAVGADRGPLHRAARLIAAVAVVAGGVATVSTGSAFAGVFATTTIVTVSPASSGVGDQVTLTATVVSSGIAGAPAGYVSFVNDQSNQAIGSSVALVPNAGSTTTSTATMTTTQLPSGTYAIHAVYLGDYVNFLYIGSTSLSVQLSVSAATVYNTALALSADSLNVVTNHPVTLTATVSEAGGASTPTGTVTFDDSGNGNGSPVRLGSATLDGTGKATLTVSDFSIGTHTITATYQGNSRDNPSNATVALTASAPFDPRVNTTVTTQVSPTTITANDVVTITAHVVQAGTSTPPIGSNVVIFTSSGPLGNNVLLGQSNTLDANGNASLRLGGWLTGNYTITASYVGNAWSFSSSGYVPLSVLPGRNASTLTYTGATTADYNDSATLSVHLSDYTTGLGLSNRPISLAMGTQSCSPTTDGGGNASCTIVVSQPVGTYPITATFSQDIHNRASSTSGTFTVTPEQTTISSSFARGSATTTLSATLLEDGTVPLAGRTVTFALGAQTCTGTTDSTGSASCTVPTLNGQVTATLSATFAGDSQYASAVDSETVRLQIETQVVYTGATSGDYHDAAALSARLLDDHGAGFGNETLTLSVGSQTCTAKTAADGTASCNVTPLESAGTYPINVSFDGDGPLLASSTSSSFTVTQEQTAIVSGLLPFVWNSSTIPLSAFLFEDGTTPIMNGLVTLTLGTSSCTTHTNLIGVAVCSVPALSTLGPTTATVSFAGDAYYAPASASKTVLVFSFAPGGGSFVIGDRDENDTVNFWGSQWSKGNSLSDGKAPSSFKGFARDTPNVWCGSTWSTDPGNSAPPPSGPLPSYMGVIETSSSSKSGSKISGTITHIVVVKTDDGYDSNPGHAGTGTVVASVC